MLASMAEPDDLIEALGPKVATYPERLRLIREILLANAVMVGEIPAPTFGEELRMRFLQDRFTESGLDNISIDEMGSCQAMLPGTGGSEARNILVLAHVDTVFSDKVDHTVEVAADRMIGAGVADNSLGVATIASLPSILDALDVELEANLILVGVARSLGRGDLAGSRFFVENTTVPIHAGVCVEGIHLGRLSYSSLGMVRGEITVEREEVTDWEKYGTQNALVTLNRIVTKILGIPVPQEPRTSIVLGSIYSGTAFNTPPAKAHLRFEVRSEEEGMAGRILDRLHEIVEEISATQESEVTMEIIAQRRPGGLDYGHPLVRATRGVMKTLGVKQQVLPSTGDLSALTAAEIPGITLGITAGENTHEFNEAVEIEPIFAGLAQLVGVLQAIDGGICDE